MVNIKENDADKIAGHLRKDILRIESNIKKAQELYDDVSKVIELDINPDTKDFSKKLVIKTFEELQKHHEELIQGLEQEIYNINHLIEILICGSDFSTKSDD